jgi:hypothetical protein
VKQGTEIEKKVDFQAGREYTCTCKSSDGFFVLKGRFLSKRRKKVRAPTLSEIRSWFTAQLYVRPVTQISIIQLAYISDYRYRLAHVSEQSRKY